MVPQQVLSNIKNLITQGELEQAIEQLLAALDGKPQYDELIQIVRLNQADLFQTKSQVRKGVISNEDARIFTNQATDNILYVVVRLQAGKSTFKDAEVKEESFFHASKWKYYAIGGAITLAAVLAGWYFWRNETPKAIGCTNFDQASLHRVMILPFLKTGIDKSETPEIEIMDGLQKLIDNTPGLAGRSLVDVNECYNISKNYPNAAEAADTARKYNATMIIWGRLKKLGSSEQLVVKYKLLDAGGVHYSGDTTINPVHVRDEGEWHQSNMATEAVIQLLYLALTNQSGVQVAQAVLDDIKSQALAMNDKKAESTNDTANTSILLEMQGDALALAGENDVALARYSQAIDHNTPDRTLLQKRGLELYDQGDYHGAARDLEAGIKDISSAQPQLVKARTISFLKSGQPAKAESDLKEFKKMATPQDASWIKQTEIELNETKASLQKERAQLEQAVKKQPKDVKKRTAAAKVNENLGNHDRAIKMTSEVLKKDPDNFDAVITSVKSYLGKGDSVSARKVLQQAQRAGVDPKEVIKVMPKIDPLLMPAPPKEQ